MRTPPAAPGQIIGVMGGSFNPPHGGHLQVAETALRRLALDRLWWVVSPGNPLKDNGALPSLAERIAACRAMIKDPRVEITGFEAELGRPHTAHTLAFLHARYPAVGFIWIMGADNLAQFHQWRHWRRIAQRTPFAVVDRPGWRLKALASPAGRALSRYRLPETKSGVLTEARPPAWVLLTSRLSAASSTALREAALKSGAKKRQDA